MDTIDCFRLDANRKINPATRSKFGQFMTNASVANFMASLFANMSGEIRLLDAGAGVGSLTAAFIQEACNRQEKPNTINATVYEIEPIFFEHLKETISKCKKLCSLNNIPSVFTFFKDDFIETNSDLLSNSLFDKNKLKEYSHVILNPPYKKIVSSSKQRKLMSRIGIETSNLYTGFLAIAINLLQNNGEMVVIVPRSFCNGPYFKPFRKLLLSTTAFKHIHVFGSRKKAFKEDDDKLEKLFELAPSLKDCYNLREELYEIFELEGISKEDAKEKIDEWCEKANLFETKGFNPFTSFTKTYRNFEENILNYFTDRISSGPVEGLNNKIKVIKRRGFGFRNITNFAKRLFLDINYKPALLPPPTN